MPVLKIKDEKGNWIKLPYVIKIIQKGDITENKVSNIEKMIVSLLESKTVKEVEG